MKFLNKISVMIMALMCSVIILGNYNALAASASMSFGTDVSSIKAGQTFTVTVIIDSSDSSIGNVEATVLYDDDMLEVVSADDYVKGDAGLLKISDNDDQESQGGVKNYNVTFKALKKGSVTFSVSNDPKVYSFADGEAMSVSAKTVTLNIGAGADANTDSALKVLDLNEGTLDPEFDPAVYAYSIHVPYNTEKLYIDAQPNDVDKAKVTVIGNEDLKVGANNVIVTVTAEDGSTTDYTINVFRETQDDSVEPGTIESVIGDKDFSVYEDGDGNEFIQNGVTYQVIDVDDDSIIPSGYVKTKLNIYNKITITAYTIQNDYDNDYMLVYCQNVKTKDTGFYQYDRVERTLQRYTGTIANANNTSAAIKETSAFTQGQKMTVALVISILAALVIILLILLIKSFIKIKGLRADEID